MPFLRILCSGQRVEQARRFDLALDQTSLGRAANNHVVIEEEGVSRTHAWIVRTPHGWEIADNASQYGVIVDGQRVQRAPLRDGAQIQLGKAQILFCDLTAGETRAMDSSAVKQEAAAVPPPIPRRASKPKPDPKEASRAPNRIAWLIALVMLLTAGIGVAILYVVKQRGEKQSAPPGTGTASAPETPRPPSLPLAPIAKANVWHGSLEGGLDFRLHSPTEEQGVQVFQYEAWRRDGSGKEAGKLGIQINGRKVRMYLVDAAEQPVRAYDGIFEPDGRTLLGVAYALPDGLPSQGGTPFWATLEPATNATGPIALNSATVGALEPVVGRDAWRVVEQRFIEGRYTSLDGLDAVGLPADTLAKLKEVARVD